MLLLWLLGAGAAYMGARSMGLIGGPAAPAKRSRSTAAVPNASGSGLVAPSIPGHVVPMPSPVDLKAFDAQTGLLSKVSQALQMSGGAGGQGAPYVDAQGYWRDFGTGALYQFHDPNTGAPMGRPGYMPNRYASYVAQQQAAADAASGTAPPDGTNAGQVAQYIAQGVSTAATVAGAVAAGSDAAATAGAVAGVAGSIAACLGPQPASASQDETGGWVDVCQRIMMIREAGRVLVLTTSRMSGGGWIVTAAEMGAKHASALRSARPATVVRGAEGVYAEHGHAIVGVFGSQLAAEQKGTRYADAWRKRKAAAAAKRCACEEIGA